MSTLPHPERDGVHELAAGLKTLNRAQHRIAGTNQHPINMATKNNMAMLCRGVVVCRPEMRRKWSKLSRSQKYLDRLKVHGDRKRHRDLIGPGVPKSSGVCVRGWEREREREQEKERDGGRMAVGSF